MPKTYGDAESVETLAAKLIAPYHSELATARIKYIFVETASKKNGKPVPGKVRRVTGALEFLLNIDFLVEVALDQWNELDAHRRTALVDHLLECCFGEEDEESGGAMKWKVRDPDVKEFRTILQRYGAWNEDLIGFVSVAKQVNIDSMVSAVVVATATTSDSAQH